MRRGSIRKAYKHGLIEPVARKIDRQEIDKQPGSRNARHVKTLQQMLNSLLASLRCGRRLGFGGKTHAKA